MGSVMAEEGTDVGDALAAGVLPLDRAALSEIACESAASAALDAESASNCESSTC